MSLLFYPRDAHRKSFFLLFLLCITLMIQACSQDSVEPQQDASAGYTPPSYLRINPPHAEDLMDTHIYQLSNGLLVYLTANHEEPRFHAEIAVKAGSKHDPADATGLAHYLEHLLFKGNRQLGTLDYEAEKPHLELIGQLYEQHFQETDPAVRADIYAQINQAAQQAAQYAIPNEIDKLYNSMGGSGLNAHTWHEETVYKVSLPSNRLEQWAEIESNRFIDPVFRLFHTELETVYEELNRSLDNKDRLSYNALSELLYKQHPYGQQTTIGSPEHLRNPSLNYIRDYYDTYYVPNNMAILISGDIDIEETIELIAEKFSAWESKPVPRAGPWIEEDIRSVERTTVRYRGEEEVQIAFRTVAANHADREALMLLDMILDNRTAGLINLNLNQSQRVLAAGSSPEFHNDYGSQRLWGVPKEGQSLEEVERLLLEQIELVKRGEFEDWILPAIVNDFKKGQKRMLESNTARVASMRAAFLAERDWGRHVTEISRLESLRKTDIVAVANRYFQQNYVAVHRINEQQDIPTVVKPQIDPVVIDPTRVSEFAARILEMPYEEIEPTYVEPGEDYRIVEYAHGVDLYYAPNPLNDLFSFSIHVETGTEDNDYLSLAGALLDKAGAAGRSADDLQKEWYRLGSDFSMGVGDNESAFAISGLDENLAPSLALMLEVVRNPTAEEETLEELKQIILKSRADQKEDPRAISQALYLYNRYGEESPLLRTLSSQQIRDAQLEQLLALPRELLGFQHTLSYTGSLPLDEVLAVLQEVYPVSGQLRETPPFRFRFARPVEDTEIYLVDRETAQAQVRIEFPDGVMDESLVIPSSIYNSYFGTSMSSVVFQELREARALAYSASAQYAQGSRLDAENMMIGAIGSQNDKAVDATAAFIELMDNMPRSTERFQEARDSLINRYRTSTVGFRQMIPTVRAWERQGLNGDPRPQRFATLQSFTMENLLGFQREHVSGRPKLISIVGDLSRIDTEQLAQFGSIRQLQVDELFVE